MSLKKPKILSPGKELIQKKIDIVENGENTAIPEMYSKATFLMVVKNWDCVVQGYIQHFLLLPQCFQNSFSLGLLKL